MLLIPEKELVVILPPRTGTNSVKNQVLATYPKASLIGRHLERGGEPEECRSWQKVSVIRDPYARLWSLFKYLRDYDLGRPLSEVKREYMQRCVESTRGGYEQWLMEDSLPIGPNLSDDRLSHPIAETRKSQAMYVGQCSDTKLYAYEHSLPQFFDLLGISDLPTHITKREAVPMLSKKALDFVRHYHGWDLAMLRSLQNTGN